MRYVALCLAIRVGLMGRLMTMCWSAARLVGAEIWGTLAEHSGR